VFNLLPLSLIDNRSATLVAFGLLYTTALTAIARNELTPMHGKRVAFHHPPFVMAVSTERGIGGFDGLTRLER